MIRSIVLSLTAMCLLPAVQAADEKINYTDHVRPIFREKCFSCHNTNKKSANLDLSTYSALMQGGASGEVIERGSAADSYLYMLIAHESEPYMPPESDPIPDAMLETVRSWIDGGAPETSSSKVMLPKKPKVDLNVAVSAGDRPQGPPAIPGVLNLEPVLHTESSTAVSAIATSPWAPVAAVAGHKQVVLYNTDTLEPAGILRFPEGQIRVLKFSRNGSLLLAGGGRGGSKGLAVVWDVRSGERVFEVGDELDEVLGADISADQEFVALGGPQKIVRVYNTSTGELAWEVAKHTDWIMSVEFSPDAVLLATSDRAGGLHVWETYTGRHYSTLLGHSSQVNDVSWRIDSNVLASASQDASIKLWEMEGGKAIKSWNAHGGGTSSVEFCRDGRVVSCGRDKLTKLWDQNGKQLVAFEAFADLALRVSHCDETNRVIAGDWTGALRVWNAADGKRLGELTSNPPMLATRLGQAESALPAAVEAQKAAQAAYEKTAAAHKTESDRLAMGKATLKTAQEMVAALKKDKSVQEPALSEAKTKLSELQNQLAALNKALPALKQAADSAAAAAAALPEDKELMEASAKVANALKTRSESSTTLQKQVESTQQDVTQRETTLKELLAKRQQNQKAATKADADVKAATAALEPLQPQLASTQQAASSAKGKMQDLQAEVERWKQFIALRDELNALEQQQQVKDQQQLAMLEAEAELKEHQVRIDASQSAISQYQQTMALQQKLTTDLQSKIQTTKLQEQEQQALVEKHQQAIPILQEALKQAQAALALLPDDAVIKTSIDGLNSAITAKQQSMLSTQQAVVKTQESVKTDEAAVAAAATTISTAQEQMTAEEQTLSGLMTARAPLVTATAAATTAFQAAEQQYNQAAQAVSARRSKIRPETKIIPSTVSK